MTGLVSFSLQLLSLHFPCLTAIHFQAKRKEVQPKSLPWLEAQKERYQTTQMILFASIFAQKYFKGEG